MFSDSKNLDFLRAVAVLCVLACHLATVSGLVPKKAIFNLGHVGVLIFFVHTSMVLMGSLERQLSRTSNRLWLRFMVRRAFRIYPLSIMIVLITVGFALPSTGFDFYTMTVVQLSPLGFISNLLLAQNLTFSPSAPAPLWSLPYEMQMYCLLPFLFLLIRKHRSVLTVFLMWLGAFALALLFVYEGANRRFIERLDLIQYGPCFIPGIMAYRLTTKARLLPSWMWPITVLMLVGAFQLCPIETWLPQWLLCLSVGLAIPLFADIQSRTLHKISHSIAKYSYGIYLGHTVCLWAFFILGRNLPTILQWLGAVSLTGVLSIVWFHLLEQPMIRFGGKLSEKLIPSLDADVVSAVSAKAS